VFGRLALALPVLATLALAGGAQEVPPIENPYAEYYAKVVRVIDGDTIAVSVALWPGLTAEYSVRERGIDAPELRRADCDEERSWAIDAQEELEERYEVGSWVRLENVEYDAFSGRVLADIRRHRSDRWLYLEKEMIDAKMAVAWTPEMDDVPWCLLAQSRSN
jgi:micrococcal nuclease